MNNPADTLAALADKLVTDWQQDGNMPPMAWHFREFAIDAMNRALASLKGEAEPVAWAVLFNGEKVAVRDLPMPALAEQWTQRPLIYGDTAPPPQQAGMSALNDGLERFKVQVEKRLCTILGKRWQPAGGGICIDNLCEEIAARLGGPQADDRAHGGGEIDYTDIANRAQAVTGRSIWPSTVKAILDVATPPAQQPGEVGEDAVFRMAAWMAREEGHDDPHHLIWEGNPPEPWGEVWNRYEGKARAALTAALAPKEKGNGT